MKISRNMWNHAWKIALTVALAVGGYFGFTPNSQEAQESKQPANSSSTSATGVEGGIHINNYPSQPPAPQPVAQPSQQNSLGTEEPKLTKKNRLVSQNITQEMGDNNTGTSQIIGEDNTVNISSERNEIEEQTNIERNIETDQYNENNGVGNTNCLDSNAACGNNGTNNFNPAQ